MPVLNPRDQAHKTSINYTNTMEEKIMEKLQEIKELTLLAAKSVLTIKDVMLLTGLSKSSIYKKTCAKEIPHYKPTDKLLYFDRKEIEAWMRQGKVKSNAEIEEEAVAYCISQKSNSNGRRAKK